MHARIALGILPPWPLHALALQVASSFVRNMGCIYGTLICNPAKTQTTSDLSLTPSLVMTLALLRSLMLTLASFSPLGSMAMQGQSLRSVVLPGRALPTCDANYLHEPLRDLVWNPHSAHRTAALLKPECYTSQVRWFRNHHILSGSYDKTIKAAALGLTITQLWALP